MENIFGKLKMPSVKKEVVDLWKWKKWVVVASSNKWFTTKEEALADAERFFKKNFGDGEWVKVEGNPFLPKIW